MDAVSTTVLDMSMSLDGFVVGANDGPDNGLGDGGMRLHGWLEFDTSGQHVRDGSSLTGVNGRVMQQLLGTGAVLTGRRTFEFADRWGGDHHAGVRIVVYTQREPDPAAADWPNVHYVTDIAEAAQLARDAAGGREVLVHGIRTAQDALAAGVLDEVQLHVVPFLLGAGRRLTEDGIPREFDLLRAEQGEGGVVHLRYRVRR